MSTTRPTTARLVRLGVDLAYAVSLGLVAASVAGLSFVAYSYTKLLHATS